MEGTSSLHSPVLSLLFVIALHYIMDIWAHPPKGPCSVEGAASLHSPVVSAAASVGSPEAYVLLSSSEEECIQATHPPKRPCRVEGESSLHSPVVSAAASAGSSWPSWMRYSARSASGSRTPSAASASASCASLAPGLQSQIET